MQTVVDQKLQAALEYAGRGWVIVPCYGLADAGICECRKHESCRTPGKHPRLKEWQTKASTNDDVISEWWERWPLSNVGVVLGPRSGIIDIEYDSAEGQKTANELIGECYTPTFQSKRSVHRLFLWNDLIPDIETADGKIDVRGLEVRLGHRVKGFQSIFPPSEHGSGVQYRWLPGLSPSDVELLEIPESVFGLIQAYADFGEIPANLPPKSALRIELRNSNQIWEGEGRRNDHLHAEACGLWRNWFRMYGPGVFEHHERQAEIYDIVNSHNLAKCRPPLDQDELHTLFNSARRFVQEQAAKENGASSRNLTSLGLEFRDGEWWPGNWRAEIVESDPPEVRLYLPALNGDRIEMYIDAFDDPQRVHVAALVKSKGAICLSDRPGFWPSVWNGSRGDKKAKISPTVGLKAKLLTTAQRITSPKELTRVHEIAEFVWSIIGNAKVKEAPKSSDRVFRDTDGALWFQFSELQTKAKLQGRDFTRPEFSKFIRNCGARDVVKVVGTDRRNYMVLEKPAQETIQALAAEGRSRTTPI